MPESQNVIENQDIPEYFMMVVVFVSVLFWAGLFIYTQGHVKFAVDKNFIAPHNLISKQQLLVYQCDFAENFSMEKYEDMLRKKAEAMKTQEPVIIAILVFMLVNLIVFIYFSDTPVKKALAIPLLFVFLFDAVCSYLLYRCIFYPFSTDVKEDQQLFKLVQTFFFLIINYHIFRKLHMFFMAEEPKIVGQWGLFFDFANWLFTFLVIGSSVVAALLIPWPQ